MIFIVLAGFLLNGNKSKYCVLPDPCAGVPEVPVAGYARLSRAWVSSLLFFPLLKLLESLLTKGNREDAIHFYHTYLRKCGLTSMLAVMNDDR